jgi:hypothetical protein
MRWKFNCAVLAFACANFTLCAAVWQWSVPAPTIPDRRAFLWIPPDCKHVRGLVVACQNMIEKPLFERPAFREACAENDLGIVLIFSGHDATHTEDKDPNHPPRSYLDIFLNPNYAWGKSSDADENPKLAGEDLQKVLDALADESGYEEIRVAPLMPVGHSSAGPFVWHLYKWNPGRIFAMMPFKTAARDGGPEGIPIFDVNSEWFEFGNSPMRNVSLVAPDGGARVPRFRQSNTNALYSYYVDVGDGHCDASDDAIGIMRLFLKKVVAARIPKDVSPGNPVQLKSVSVESGWLLVAATFGKLDGKPVKYSDWKGDPQKCFWYLDKDLAEAVQNNLAKQLSKEPQQIGFVQDGVASTDARMFNFTPKFLDDAGTFKLDAAFVDHIDHAKFDDRRTNYYPVETKLGHSDTPILFRVNSGALVQTGSNTFRICPHAGPIMPQGNPWEPTIVAYNLGDKEFRPTEHPAHVNVSIINKTGVPQTIDFAKIPDQKLGTKSVKLEAKASSGLPVQYFLVSGPATIEGDTLKLEKIPVHAKFPIRILVSVFQWGRSSEPKVQSAGPVLNEFFIEK